MTFLLSLLLVSIFPQLLDFIKSLLLFFILLFQLLASKLGSLTQIPCPRCCTASIVYCSSPAYSSLKFSCKYIGHRCNISSLLHTGCLVLSFIFFILLGKNACLTFFTNSYLYLSIIPLSIAFILPIFFASFLHCLHIYIIWDTSSLALLRFKFSLCFPATLDIFFNLLSWYYVCLRMSSTDVFSISRSLLTVLPQPTFVCLSIGLPCYIFSLFLCVFLLSWYRVDKSSCSYFYMTIICSLYLPFVHSLCSLMFSFYQNLVKLIDWLPVRYVYQWLTPVRLFFYLVEVHHFLISGFNFFVQLQNFRFLFHLIITDLN